MEHWQIAAIVAYLGLWAWMLVRGHIRGKRGPRRKGVLLQDLPPPDPNPVTKEYVDQWFTQNGGVHYPTSDQTVDSTSRRDLPGPDEYRFP